MNAWEDAEDAREENVQVFHELSKHWCRQLASYREDRCWPEFMDAGRDDTGYPYPKQKQRPR